ncbi:ribonuclease HI family protein [Candidatus Gottesmanbacteria bacterium]|nr:ribonuclease HI family protein [Candidatus Gottesmanbacteria bacterium]
MKLVVHTDGGARGNPGPAAIGVVIEIIQNSKFKIQNEIEISRRIGETTNNVAEYTAVVEALKNIKGGENTTIDFFLDSTLVVNQLNGLFKVKDAKLRELLSQIQILEQEAGGVITYTSVPREKNQRADFLVNQALDRT